jgi:hypothetical protein
MPYLGPYVGVSGMGASGAVFDDAPRASPDQIRAMGAALNGLQGLSGSNSDRLRGAGLNFLERVASGGPVFTVGATADIGPGAQLAAVVGAAVPIIIVLGVAWIIWGRK